MENNMLGLKEMYECTISATYDIEVGGKVIHAGEPIVTFDSLQLANFDEIKSRSNAEGGYGNQAWVTWEHTQEMTLRFSQGVFSRIHLALLGNSDLRKAEEVDVPRIEHLELDENLRVTLRYEPTVVYVYNKENGARYNEVEIVDNEIIVHDAEPYTEVEVFYTFLYTDVHVISVGRQLIRGFLQMTAKTRLKDDMTGKTVTGIFRIPKMKLMSDFSIRLGNDAPPAVGNFRITAYPTGSKGSEKVMDFILLNDDIDSDF